MFGFEPGGLFAEVNWGADPAESETSDVAPRAGEAGAAASHAQRSDKGKRVAGTAAVGALTLGALGVVFGDIGTSPLYAMQTGVYHGGHPSG
jgi:KUP system potassium uptake protein